MNEENLANKVLDAIILGDKFKVGKAYRKYYNYINRLREIHFDDEYAPNEEIVEKAYSVWNKFEEIKN